MNVGIKIEGHQELGVLDRYFGIDGVICTESMISKVKKILHTAANLIRCLDHDKAQQIISQLNSDTRVKLVDWSFNVNEAPYKNCYGVWQCHPNDIAKLINN